MSKTTQPAALLGDGTKWSPTMTDATGPWRPDRSAIPAGYKSATIVPGSLSVTERTCIVEIER